jgi:hypothetical protein
VWRRVNLLLWRSAALLVTSYRIWEFGHLRSRLGAAVAIDLISTSEYSRRP